MCMRFHQSSPLFRPDLEIGEISLEQFKSWFSPDFLRQQRVILFCGVHGDPCIARDTLEITKYIIEHSPNTNILFNTNGGMRNPEWWMELGATLKDNQDNWVTFSIDGLEDTNHIYRRNVKWEKVMANVKAFIGAGGRAHWDFLMFKHNEHQIEQAKHLATEMGFTTFTPKKALGVDNGIDLTPMGALNKEGQREYIIEAPLNPNNRILENYRRIGDPSGYPFTPELYKQQKEEKLIQQRHKSSYTRIYEVIDDKKYDKENKCHIKCKSLRDNIVDIFIDNYGNVLPCCYVGTHLNGNYEDVKTLQLHHDVKKYGLEKFNLNHNTIENIIKERHIDNVFTNSWTKSSISAGKMLFCADTCGQESHVDKIHKHEGKTNLKMKTIHAFGDSFTVGDQDDFDKYKDFCARLEYVRYNVSYISHVAKALKLNLVNYAERGSGNFPQVDKLYLNLLNGKIKESDIVFFGLSTSCRDRSTCIELEKSTSVKWGECIVDRALLLSGDFQTLTELDYFYTLSVIDQLRKKFNVRIIVMQAFDHCLDNKINHKHLFNFKDFIGCELINSTFIDILNDTWGIENPIKSCDANHLTLIVPEGYEHLYTKDRHPSVIGHEKIAAWILKNINF